MVRDFNSRTIWAGTPSPASSVIRPRTVIVDTGRSARAVPGRRARSARRAPTEPRDAAATRAPDICRRKNAPSAIVRELHVEVEGAVAQDLDGGLKVILVLALDADLVPLDGRLDLDPARLEDLYDFLGL